MATLRTENTDALRAAHVATKRAAHGLTHPLGPKLWRALLVKAVEAQNALLTAPTSQQDRH